MSTLERRFGHTVREARQHQRWSQERLAEAADLNRSYLGEIERGLVSPSLATMQKLAAALQLTPADLLSRCQHASLPQHPLAD